MYGLLMFYFSCVWLNCSISVVYGLLMFYFSCVWFTCSISVVYGLLDLFQLCNYGLEKKLRENEHQEKLQAADREQHIQQASRFETQYKQLHTTAEQLMWKQGSLEGQGKCFLVIQQTV